MKLVYDTKDKPKFGQLLVFALQQLLAIVAATIAVPMIVSGSYDCGDVQMSTVAALVGAGVGTLVYILLTKAKSPVFLGSSFAFLGSMSAAFAGAATVALGYLGLILGAACAGLVYVLIALVVKLCGVKWINKLMPPIVIGPTVAIIGFTLAGNAIDNLQKGSFLVNGEPTASVHLCILCGLITLFVTMVCSVFGKKLVKLIPFIIGILAGYAIASVATVIGITTGNDAWKIIDFSSFTALFADGVHFSSFITIPDFSFLKAFGAFDQLTPGYFGTIAVAYVPVAFVVLAEHIADHKNISSIIGHDLLEDPGLHRTLMGDGIGSFFGALVSGAPNTTYGESIACVALSGNASIITIVCTSLITITVAFIAPVAAFLASIPPCVIGGVCIALYGFISVSGLKMMQPLDLGDNRNLFVASVILMTGIGGLVLTFGQITITSVACALILGIIANQALKKKADRA